MQSSIMAYMGKESKEWMYVYDSLCCTAEMINIVNQLYANKKYIFMYPTLEHLNI